MSAGYIVVRHFQGAGPGGCQTLRVRQRMRNSASTPGMTHVTGMFSKAEVEREKSLLIPYFTCRATRQSLAIQRRADVEPGGLHTREPYFARPRTSPSLRNGVAPFQNSTLGYPSSGYAPRTFPCQVDKWGLGSVSTDALPVPVAAPAPLQGCSGTRSESCLCHPKQHDIAKLLRLTPIHGKAA